MRLIQVNNAETCNTELINLDNVTNITKVWGGWDYEIINGQKVQKTDVPYHGVIEFLQGGGRIIISSVDYDYIYQHFVSY